MAILLDHLFVLTAPGAPAAERLVEFGLNEGTPNAHPGQGTANRRFFFRNSMLELLWVADPREAQSESVRRLGLWDRWVGRDGAASPFGIAVRREDPGGPPPFAAWEYSPPFFPPGVAAYPALDNPMEEPFWFYFARGGRPDAMPPGTQPLEHRAGFREITGLQVTAPAPVRSEAAAALAAAGVVSFRRGTGPMLEIEFDGGGKRVADFRPELPLVFRW